jgi:formylglycine-generating enzyme required for sulfatase activity
LPNATEYNAMVKAADRHLSHYAVSDRPASIEDLLGGLAEWTTTKYNLRAAVDNQSREAASKLSSMHVLKGYGDPEKLPGLVRMHDELLAPPDSMSPMIGFRCARSGAPRFMRVESK